jgi:hypothetical protein
MTRKLLIKLTKGVGIILNGKNINPFLARNGNYSKSHVKYKKNQQGCYWLCFMVNCLLWNYQWETLNSVKNVFIQNFTKICAYSVETFIVAIKKTTSIKVIIKAW